MSLPPAVTFVGRHKWGEVAVDVGLVVLGVLLALAAGSQLSGGEPVGLLLLVAYTAYAVAATAVLAGLAVATTQLPTLREATIDGRPAVGVRSWAAPFWHAVALDAGLAVLGVALLVAGVTAGGDWGAVAAVPALVGLWFLVRVVLVLTGRRRRAALWLTEDELVLDSPLGRARARRDDVRRVRSRGRRLVVELDGDAEWLLCPRPWRPALDARDTLVLDCADIGHRAATLTAWLTEQVAGVAAEQDAPVSTGRRWGRSRGAR